MHIRLKNNSLNSSESISYIKLYNEKDNFKEKTVRNIARSHLEQEQEQELNHRTKVNETKRDSLLSLSKF